MKALPEVTSEVVEDEEQQGRLYVCAKSQVDQLHGGMYHSSQGRVSLGHAKSRGTRVRRLVDDTGKR